MRDPRFLFLRNNNYAAGIDLFDLWFIFTHRRRQQTAELRFPLVDARRNMVNSADY
jgi:hypothetical protein